MKRNLLKRLVPNAARQAVLRLLSAVLLLVAGGADALAGDDVHAVINGVPYVLYPDLGTAAFDYDAIKGGGCGKSMYFVRYVSYYVNGKTVKFDAGNEVPNLGNCDCFRKVESVTIGDGIEKIDDSVFANWESLQSVSLNSSDLKTIAESAFEN